MKNIHILSKIIILLSDGRYHSKRQFYSILGNKYKTKKYYLTILKNWGMKIIKKPKKGYKLNNSLNLLNREKICKNFPNKKIVILPVVSSTNQYLINRIFKIKKGDICIAEYQTNGRGRRGKKWISSFSNGLCFSIYWFMDINKFNTIGLSLMVGIIIIKTLNFFGIKESKIKWPNDLYLKGKKLAGILIEIFNKDNKINHIIIGVGINVNKDEFLKKKLVKNFTSLQETGICVDKNKFIIKLIILLYKSLKEFECQGLKPFINKWNEIDKFINCPVILKIGNQKIYGIDRGINNDGKIILERQGKLYEYIGDEVSLQDFKINNN